MNFLKMMKNGFKFFLLSLMAFLLTLSLAVIPRLIPTAAITETSNIVSQAGLKLPDVQPQFRNFWTPELENQFQQRAKTIIRHYANPKNYGNGYGENEKQSYSRAMFDFLAGNREKAIAFLQQEDPQAKDFSHTNGIDYYYCFTLKGQVRKYFLFGQYLDPTYKQRMFDGAKKWTEKDPLTRPHPIYGNGDGRGNDWSISRRGLWVDGRNTDNLRAMREVSVYLMAEETGNEETRQIYRAKLHRYVSALYNIGMGEWDSEVYHGHTFAAYLNLYDFAKDPEVKQIAKNALDWFSTAAAVKYYRGGWGGAVKRDYGGGNVAMRSSSVRTFWLYFGDTPLENSRPEPDTLYLITSTYRPPLAVVALAHKQFNKPVEILATKPLYENWKPGNDQQPAYWETQFFGQTYQMGSVASTFSDNDVAPFKLLTYNSQRGVDYFVANSRNHKGDWVRPGKNPGDQIGQYRNLLIWLRPSDRSFFFQFPKTATLETDRNIWFIKLEKTWLAIHPINLKFNQFITINNKKFTPIYTQEQTLEAIPEEQDYTGFALEVGEENSYKNYENFKQTIKQKSELNLVNISQGNVKFRGSSRETLELTYNQTNLLPKIIRNKKEHNWSKSLALYNSFNQDRSPIYLGWKQGRLSVKAGDYQFTSRMSFATGVTQLRGESQSFRRGLALSNGHLKVGDKSPTRVLTLTKVLKCISPSLISALSLKVL